VRGGGELAHVQADLGDDHLGGLAADAGDLIEAIGRGERDRRRLGVSALAGGVATAAPVAEPGLVGGWLGSGDGRDQLLDPGREAVYLGGQRVDVVQQHPGQFGVVVVEAAGQRLHQGGALAAHPSSGELGERLGVALPDDQGLQHGSTRDAHDDVGHGGQPGQASSSSLHPAAARAGNVPGSGRTAAGCRRATGESRWVG
jgi:hypothetical protein